MATEDSKYDRLPIDPTDELIIKHFGQARRLLYSLLELFERTEIYDDVKNDLLAAREMVRNAEAAMRTWEKETAEEWLKSIKTEGRYGDSLRYLRST